MSSNHLRKSPEARRIGYWQDYRQAAARYERLVQDGCTEAMVDVARCLRLAVEWRALAYAAEFETDAGTKYADFIRRFMA